MRRFTKASIALAATASLALTACGDDKDEEEIVVTTTADNGATETTVVEVDKDDHDDHDDHHAHGAHKTDGGEAPAGMTEASNPRFKVGEKVRIDAEHMPGMEDAIGTVTGAYTTTAYEVDYIPTDGSPRVDDHKWVVQEELQDPGNAPLRDGDPIVIDADHLDGMKGAKGTIEDVEQTTVYMVDFEANGQKYTNHKWVTEDELEKL
ncbi:YdhK family protein [Corynebacterium pelargi]|uniref:Uncharacterized protein n=1 Tax=Corynebacterium pelargi TaxID=1471400 RepID=A0A410W885_9CORY|nr:YdhK family protein [Corynebacterium pelargi]QAU52170.1 hypothetical protein CPELA_04455 [Corynebacterium pelargi]GGG69638.1 hypothetical protein GCM10007338_03010 [Corynebacterium pelargi]